MQIYVRLKLPFLGRFPLLDAILTRIRLRKVTEWEEDEGEGGGVSDAIGRASAEEGLSGVETDPQAAEEMKPKVSIRITAGCNETVMLVLVALTDPFAFQLWRLYDNIMQVINWDEGTYGGLTLGTIHIYGDLTKKSYRAACF